MTGADSEPGDSPQRHSDGDDGMALGDGVLAVLGVLTLLLLFSSASASLLGLGLVTNPGMMGGLLLVVVLALLTGVATYTAVIGRAPSLTSRVAGGVLAVLGVGVVILGVDHLPIVGVPMLTVGAGIGRTHSWRLRLVGLVGVVGLLVVLWVTARVD